MHHYANTLGCEIQLFDVENLPYSLFGSSMCCDNALWILVVWLQELRLFSPILVKMQCIVGASLSAGYTCLQITVLFMNNLYCLRIIAVTYHEFHLEFRAHRPNIDSTKRLTLTVHNAHDRSPCL